MAQHKRLYESIMSSISHNLKKVLNESFIDSEEEMHDIDINYEKGANAIYEQYKEQFNSLFHGTKRIINVLVDKNTILIPGHFKYDLNTLCFEIYGNKLNVDILFELLNSDIPVSKLGICTVVHTIWCSKNPIDKVPDVFKNIELYCLKYGSVDLDEVYFTSEKVQQDFFDAFKIYTDDLIFDTDGNNYSDYFRNGFKLVVSAINGLSYIDFNNNRIDELVCMTSYFLAAYRENMPPKLDYVKGVFDKALHNENVIKLLTKCKSLNIGYETIASAYYKSMQEVFDGKQ